LYNCKILNCSNFSTFQSVPIKRKVDGNKEIVYYIDESK
jgi:hypothetical protein